MDKFFYILLFIGFFGYAQDKDLPQSSTKSKGAILSKGKVSSGNNLLGIPNRPKVKNLFAKPEKGINFKPKEQFTNPSDLYTKKLNAKPEDENNRMKEEFGNDMYLGDFVTTSDKMVFLCRDHMMFDGDRVQVRLNGEILIQNLLLENAYKEITIPLEVGFNKIEFVALNQGESGPNTAELKAIDNGNLITRNIWNLLTGIKASAVIVRN
ncbi:hypothetical protein SAMN05444278_10164 [Psychroflexus salarius]|uniref:Secreted protein n=1 Tax=Psychroflexus salarius TaxID=1155689 RepID=A0A1M4SB57_9FLAO|nr:hypothetical protein [Psychroflexus salarius]SHE29408.1 hypothetical protein SAMN05444278_10164 [Psychroflexus salarius]